jgi:hypothetical protein
MSWFPSFRRVRLNWFEGAVSNGRSIVFFASFRAQRDKTKAAVQFEYPPTGSELFETASEGKK